MPAPFCWRCSIPPSSPAGATWAASASTPIGSSRPWVAAQAKAREVYLSEAGPLGWVWSEICGGRERAGAVAEVLESWLDREPVELWEDLVARAPLPDRAARAAQVTWIQGRAAGNTPIAWSEERHRWEMGELPFADGSPRAMSRAYCGHFNRLKPIKGKGFNKSRAGGLLSTRAPARRIRAIADALCRLPVHFHHGDATEAIPAGPLDGWDIYLDPPYQGATSYAADMPRGRLLAWAQDLRERGATLTISEACPLPLPDVQHVEITRPGGKPEWLTCTAQR